VRPPVPAGAGALGSKRPPRGADGEPEHVPPSRVLGWPAALAGLAGQRNPGRRCVPARAVTLWPGWTLWPV